MWIQLSCIHVIIGSLSNDDGDVNENGKKSIGSDWQNWQLCTCITLFCTFFCRHCTTTTWKCLISRFVEVVNTRQRSTFLSFQFPDLWYILLFQLQKNNDGINAIKFEAARFYFFEWRFRSHRRRCCLSSVISTVRTHLSWTEGISSCRWDPCGSSQ